MIHDINASEWQSSDQSCKERPKLGLIGCGNIGGRQAANFLAHGYAVYVYDIKSHQMSALEAQGAYPTSSCADLAAQADIIFTALPTPDDVLAAVLEGENSLVQTIQPGSIYIDVTTNSPEIVLQLNKALEPYGVAMLDAPFNDCPVGATSQQGLGLAVLASGDPVVFERVEPILKLMADHVLYCGAIGNGTRCKLIHNAINAVAVQAVSEGISLGLANGLELQTIWDALRLGAFGQNAGDIHGLPHYWFSRRFDDPSQHPAFTIQLLLKDLRLSLQMAQQSNVPVGHIALTIQDYEEAERRGWSHYAASKVRCLQEERARVTAQGNFSTGKSGNDIVSG
ncbi:MAG: NAD(P)-dependent oxidoreductase [Symploca sp. SIO2G7]|nr:NAD(P)-dependent oxidoreductase [Symploca sp. SIO2G7]